MVAACPVPAPGSSYLQHVKESARLARLAVRLTWRASPRLAAGIFLLVAAQAVLPPVQLGLVRAVIDRAALDLGLGSGAAADVVSIRLPLLAWVLLAAAAIAAARLLQALAARLQATALAGNVGIVREQIAFLPSLFRVLDAPPDLPIAAVPRPGPRPIREGIAFEHVAFAYPTTDDRGGDMATRRHGDTGLRVPASPRLRVSALRPRSSSVRAGAARCLLRHPAW